MKKYTNFIGYLAAFASVLGLNFKVMHWPYSGVIIAVAIALISIFFCFYVIDKMRESEEGKILPFHVVAAIAAFLFTNGFLFKLEHWPGASILLILGIGGFGLIFLPMLVYHKSKKEGENNMLNITGAIGLALFVLGILFKFQHWPGPPVLFIAGIVLLFLIYFPLFMMSSSIPAEKKHSELRDIFFTVIIACFILFFTMFIIGSRVSPPSETSAVTTEQTD